MSPSRDPFESTEEYYASHRPAYCEAAFEHLRERFDLGEADRVLDLGCGAGQVAVPVAAHAGRVVGMDPSETMLREAADRADAAGRENLEWVVGSDADLHGEMGPFRVTTMGRAFHRMDRRATLETLHEVTEPGGGVAILNDAEWFTRGTKGWQDVVYALADEYLADLPERTGPVTSHEDPWDELLRDCGYADVWEATFEFEREWTVDGVVGYVFSLSYCSPKTFGEDRAAFEADLRARLDDRDGEPFRQDARVTVLTGLSGVGAR